MLKKIKYLLKLFKKEKPKKVWMMKTKKMMKKVHLMNKKMFKKEKKWARVQLKMSQELLQAVKSQLNLRPKKF
jgi:hypothetical protein